MKKCGDRGERKRGDSGGEEKAGRECEREERGEGDKWRDGEKETEIETYKQTN